MSRDAILVTIDLAPSECDYLLRVLAAHMSNTTKELRALNSALSAPVVIELYEEIRTAAMIAGRLSWPPRLSPTSRETPP